jgi:hypothetical protein
VKYRVLIDDNYKFMDESERLNHGTFETAEEALAACRAIVDEWLAEAFKPGMSADDLWQSYVAHGDDPFVMPVNPKDAPAVSFDAWEHACQRCQAMGRGDVNP